MWNKISTLIAGTPNGMLTTEQQCILNNLLEEIKESWSTQVIWRTWTEANYSVLNDLKFPTKAAKYHQAKKEQIVFFENLILLSFDFEEAQIDLAETEQLLSEEQNHFAKQRLEVRRNRLLFSLEGMKLQAKERVREIKMWSEIMKSLDDGTFDTENKDTDELIGLTIRYCRELPAAQRTKDAGAAINIVGQATTMFSECQRRGLLDQLGPDGKKARKMLRGG